MRYYECPNCGLQKLQPKSNGSWKCKACEKSFIYKQYSRQDIYHKKHIDTPNFIEPDKDLVKIKVPKIKKTKQHCEHITQQALRAIPDIWYTKLQVNPNAHTPTVGDYMILTKEQNIILECKELDTTKNDRIPFSRFTQIGNMTAFEESLARNQTYFVILLWGGYKFKSVYVIPLKSIQAHIKLAVKKSMNIQEIESNFSCYKVPFENLENYFRNLFN
jgi:hypothetical protein